MRTKKELAYIENALTSILDCQLLLKQKHFFNTDCDEELDDDFESEEEKQTFQKLRPFILPGDQRIFMFEWLLEQYEPGILESEEFKLIKGITHLEKIEILFKQIGLTNYSHKKGGTQNDLMKSIEGLNGTSDSIQLLLRVVQFVVTSIQCDQLGDKDLHQTSDKLLNHICTNSAQVFQPFVRLFPPGFPKTEDYNESGNLDELGEIIDELSSKIQKVQAKTTELNAQTYFDNQENIKLASEEDIKTLKDSLAELKKQILKFSEEFDDNLKKSLGQASSKQLQTQIGQIVEHTFQHKKNFDIMNGNFKGILEKLGQLNVKLQIAGLDKDNNYAATNSQITNENVLELVSQIKALKLSAACNAKFGKIQ